LGFISRDASLVLQRGGLVRLIYAIDFFGFIGFIALIFEFFLHVIGLSLIGFIFFRAGIGFGVVVGLILGFVLNVIVVYAGCALLSGRGGVDLLWPLGQKNPGPQPTNQQSKQNDSNGNNFIDFHLLHLLFTKILYPLKKLGAFVEQT
jgi:hypothetical protein